VAPTADGAWSAPGRANLIGEHTDHNEGYVLPFALPWRTTVRGARRADRRLVVTSAQAPGDAVDVDVDVDDQDPASVPAWARYVLGVAWALAGDGHELDGLTLAVDSDVPQGAGLSSSAALTCATARALDGLLGLGLPPVELARVAWRAENEFVGVPCGVMDQWAAMLAQPGHALFLDCRSLETRQVPLSLEGFGLTLLLADSGVRHRLADGSYAERRQECAAAAAALGVSALRDAKLDDLARLDDATLRRRATHVVTENQRVLDVVAALDGGRPAAIGPALTASHRSLRDDFAVSCDALDAIVAAALAAGALGARMVGAGFGGCALVLAESDALPAVERALMATCQDARPWRVRG
jgi:galactokinase